MMYSVCYIHAFDENKPMSVKLSKCVGEILPKCVNEITNIAIVCFFIINL